MKFYLAPINPIVGDVSGNLDKILGHVEKAAENDCDLIVFPELALIGYPPKDLLLYDSLLAEQTKALKTLKRHSKKLAILVGGIAKNQHRGAPFFNTCFLLRNGQTHTYQKHLLPNYDVFDERRYFEPGTEVLRFQIGGRKIAISICEDVWYDDEKLKTRYHHDPLNKYERFQLDYLINISASPFEFTKLDRRLGVLQTAAKKLECRVISVNQAGANDDLIFDGCVMVTSKDHTLVNHATFADDAIIYDDEVNNQSLSASMPNPWERLHQALVTGIRDYFHKTGFKQAVLGLSGGVDSALVACLASDALGPENVLGVLMPSRYSSEGSVTDAEELAQKININTQTVPIHDLHDAYEHLFQKIFQNAASDLTEQNIQARIRGNILMAISNQTGRLLLNTTNKSEMAMGYGTLYGDMCGALAVISDLTKEQVYELCEHLNGRGIRIPQTILNKEPSAELKPNQTDSQSLPPYPVLDTFVHSFIDDQAINRNPVKDLAFFEKMVSIVMATEYKRHQAPLGLKVNAKAFGSGRRVPIVSRLPL